ncbi:MAG: Rieske 2Fe-2S domain-containing protein, partial [Chloroflexota bacterium]
ANYIFTAAVPVDDEHMIGLTVVWSPDKDVPPFPAVEVDAHYQSLRNKGNDYLIDRQEQKTKSFTGIKGVRVQDMAVQEDQRGPVSDRSTEHLGTSDLGVIATRQRLLRQARALQAGQEPAEPGNPSAFHLRSLALNAPRAVPWDELMRQHMFLGAASEIRA